MPKFQYGPKGTLSDETKTELRVVALDEALQVCVVEAMFQGCKRGPDLWEDLEEDRKMFSKQTHILLWGREYSGDLDYQEMPPCLYTTESPHLVIEYLLDQVQANVIGKIT